MNEAIRKSIEGGYTFKGKLENIGLGVGVWSMDEFDDNIVVVRRKEVEIDYATIVKYKFTLSEIREDKEFWVCLGKALGWKTYTWSSYKSYSNLNYNEETDDESWSPKTEYAERHITYVLYWHRFIDWIAEGKDVDDFFKELLTQQEEV